MKKFLRTCFGMFIICSIVSVPGFSAVPEIQVPFSAPMELHSFKTGHLNEFDVRPAIAFLTISDQLKNSRILVYTKNGKGYVHDNIAASVACIQSLAADNEFTIDVSDDASVFTADNLKKYNLLIFTSTNNDVFDNDDQRVAFRRYIEAGGGFVGIHSVTGTERNWKWFKMMIGETFSWHAKFQRFRIKKIDASHSSMQGVPAVWEREDECG